MYNLILSLLILVASPLQTENPASAPAESALIVVVNTADWCPLCQKNGERVEKELLSQLMKDDHYMIIVNDLSNEETKMASQMKLKEAGIENFTAENNGTGRIYMVHPESKKVLDKISVRKSTDKLMMALKEAYKEI
ncbi:MAG: hypothetical protein ACPGVV_00580 [Croceimicrobium sp.]